MTEDRDGGEQLGAKHSEGKYRAYNVSKDGGDGMEEKEDVLEKQTDV